MGSPYYTYVAVPVITTLTPTQGPANGGNAVTISGSHFGLTTSVLIGGTAAPFVAISDSEIVATSPGGTPGSVTVTATTPGGVSNAASYQLVASPSV
ncbi:IPT/TIG domain-containing protein [Catenulispora sp. GP43]|uniref:IPT/TIG domain-containing protein n=1 Tax=Catenulispora sp. GP43 TaxID=3156263 RepID=UPI0035183FBF